MPQLVTQFDPEYLASVIRNDYPEFIPTKTKVLDNGWDHIVLDVDDSYIFRFPLDDETQFDKELRLLTGLKGKISLPIPEISFIGKTHKYMGYAKIPGTSLPLDVRSQISKEKFSALSESLGRFLFEMHTSFTPDEARELGFGKENLPKDISEARSLLHFLDTTPHRDFAESILEEFESHQALLRHEVLLFNDLHEENMAYDPNSGSLHGIFDFSDAAIGDVHTDFRDLYAIDRILLEETVKAYESLSGTALSLRRIIMHTRFNFLSNLLKYWGKPEKGIVERGLGLLEIWSQEPDIYKTADLVG